MGAELGFWNNSFACGTLGCAALLAASSAGAETIQTRGVYASDAEIPADVQLIMMDRFGGDLGRDVELALTDVLGGVLIRSEP